MATHMIRLFVLAVCTAICPGLASLPLAAGSCKAEFIRQVPQRSMLKIEFRIETACERVDSGTIEFDVVWKDKESGEEFTTEESDVLPSFDTRPYTYTTMVDSYTTKSFVKVQNIKVDCDCEE